MNRAEAARINGLLGGRPTIQAQSTAAIRIYLTKGKRVALRYARQKPLAVRRALLYAMREIERGRDEAKHI